MANENESKENIRRICLVSGAAFSAAASVFPFAALILAPMGMVFTLAPELSVIDQETDIIKQYDNVVLNALLKTKKSFSSHSKQKILDELAQYDNTIDCGSLKSVIEHTEAYRKHYCTSTDVSEIIAVFEGFFRQELANHSQLSHYVQTNACTLTLEEMKKIYSVVVEQRNSVQDILEKSNTIKKTTRDTYQVVESIKRLLDWVLRAVIVSVIALFSFIVYCIVLKQVLKQSYSFDSLICAYICLLICELTISSTKLKTSTIVGDSTKQTLPRIMTVAIYAIVSATLFYMVEFAFGYPDEGILVLSGGVLLAGLIEGSIRQYTTRLELSSKREVGAPIGWQGDE